MEKSIIQQRRKIIEVSYQARQGHLSSSMSVLEMLNVLFKRVMSFDPESPDSNQNDKLILSKGHASLALYAVLNDMGCLTDKQFYSFSQYNSNLGEHPDKNKVPAVDVSTGSLGHGLPTAVGMAIGYKAQGKGNRVYVIIGDGEANEGSIWEAASIACKMNLDNIVCLVDDNHSASHTDKIGPKFKAFGWEVTEVNGHDINALEQILRQQSLKPHMIWCHTIKGHGCRLMEADPEGWHHRVIKESEYNQLMEETR